MKRLRKFFWPLVSTLAIVLSVYILYKDLRGLSLDEFMASINAIPVSGWILACGATHEPALVYRCPSCGGILEVHRPLAPSGRWRRQDFVADAVTLGEGDTPLREVSPGLVSPAFAGRL
ncbi:MAG: hypothetical protein J0J15_05795, partial [Mesorhizobium sp.]|nr:hypothetical protein [Mesorhizobium sp.]